MAKKGRGLIHAVENFREGVEAAHRQGTWYNHTLRGADDFRNWIEGYLAPHYARMIRALLGIPDPWARSRRWGESVKELATRYRTERVERLVTQLAGAVAAAVPA